MDYKPRAWEAVSRASVDAVAQSVTCCARVPRMQSFGAQVERHGCYRLVAPARSLRSVRGSMKSTRHQLGRRPTCGDTRAHSPVALRRRRLTIRGSDIPSSEPAEALRWPSPPNLDTVTPVKQEVYARRFLPAEVCCHRRSPLRLWKEECSGRANYEATTWARRTFVSEFVAPCPSGPPMAGSRGHMDRPSVSERTPR